MYGPVYSLFKAIYKGRGGSIMLNKATIFCVFIYVSIIIYYAFVISEVLRHKKNVRYFANFKINLSKDTAVVIVNSSIINIITMTVAIYSSLIMKEPIVNGFCILLLLMNIITVTNKIEQIA